MADIATSISTLVAGISSSASRVKVNKRLCERLARKSRWVNKRVKNGELGPQTHFALEELEQLLMRCDKDLKKFAGSGFFMRLLRAGSITEICGMHMAELDEWMGVIPEKIPVVELDDDKRDDMRYFAQATQNTKDAKSALLFKPPFKPPTRLMDRTVLNMDYLGKEKVEVGTFLFGTIYKGSYKEEAVYIRELHASIPDVSLQHLKAGIVLAKCLSDCKNIVPILGICDERMIVTAMPAKGPLSEYRDKLTRLQKATIARKIADAVLFMHDIAADKRRIVHRDIRAANVLLTDELEPMLTGFEMCKEDGHPTDYHPDVEGRLQKWWPPERKSKLGTSPESDVYSFGVLMYEISTGIEPETGDLAVMEGNKICAEYTALMEKCLHPRYNSRPKMDQVVEELLSLERMLV